MSKLSSLRVRKNFGSIPETTLMPNLIEVQKLSYEGFLQMNVDPAKRIEEGIHEVFKSIFPIYDFSDRAQLEYVKYDFEAPKYDIEECRQRGLTYASPLKLTLRLIVWDVEENTKSKNIRDIKEQEVYVGDIPLMTKEGTFIINGTERVIVSQMHRSPGVFFDHDDGKSHASGKLLFAARVIPYRGSWLDFEFDVRDLVTVRIDRRRKLLATTFLMCLDSAKTEQLRLKYSKKDQKMPEHEVEGMSPQEILRCFYEEIPYKRKGDNWVTPFDPEALRGVKMTRDIVDAETKEVIVETGQKMTPRLRRQLKEENAQRQILVPLADILGRYVAAPLLDPETGEVVAEAGDEITTEVYDKICALKFKVVQTLSIDHVNIGTHIRDTLAADKNRSREEALMDIYRVMRPGEPPTLENAEALFQSLFFDPSRYDLSAVGRVKMNARLSLETDDTLRVLRKEDVLSILKVLMDLKDGRGEVDDIDHLGNRRVRSVGELLENQYRIGVLRMERAVRERMSAVDLESVMPHDLINAKPAIGAIRDFFNSSQLSQFMDQTNPLSEITHKRRLSALGPGGLTRERAGFEVRDVHPTHYGRICPIETPEGPNIGLINSLATFARINKYGFIESPYRRVKEGIITEEVVYLSAIQEGRYNIAQADTQLDAKQKITAPLVNCRYGGEFSMVPPEKVDFIDVSPKQLVSVAASLIPFLENDDANRALMGANMQRQAVPLLRSEAPLVGTGMEKVVALDSGVAVMARRGGVVDQVDARRIVIRATEGVEQEDTGVDIYNLQKFQRSNQNTCINQKPLVKVGDSVDRGQVIADGPSIDQGELALGRNALVAFMSWKGYNFEDSIMISERMVRDDVFTSIHIEEFEVMARDTKLGQEDISRDIPNLGEDALRNLDESGIIYIGAEVKAGDVLVGKVTPKGETPMTPEEKLLRAIFGEKASDVRDTSLRVPPGVRGTVVDVRVFSRRGIEKDERAMAIERAAIEKLAKDRDAERLILEGSFYERLREYLLGHTVVKGPKGIQVGAKITEELLQQYTKGQWRQILIEEETAMSTIEKMSTRFDKTLELLQEKFKDKAEKVRRGDELSPGVMKVVKVFIAVKRKLQPGDKMAGRHGNKGVISRITPIEDMPYLEDGTPVDIILNPLGIPSRMNVGQILETHLGWAAAGLGKKIGDMLKKVQAQQSTEKELRDTVLGAYKDSISLDEAKTLIKDNLVPMSQELARGVPMATPVFDGASVEVVTKQLQEAGLCDTGQMTLIDGQTGVPFGRPVTVGYMYIMKLHHLVDDKIHARSIGPYSLVTQQPLGGKAQFGGQRFGEMEVWALEAYGAAYTLQEILTVKSDDVAGRTEAYQSIIRGDSRFNIGIPESFNVLVKEMNALGINIAFNQKQKD